MEEEEKLEKILETKLQDFKEGILSAIRQEYSSNIKTTYVDVSKVSQLINVTKKTVRNYYGEGKLIGEKESSGRLRFTREEVEKFILNTQKKKYGL